MLIKYIGSKPVKIVEYNSFRFIFVAEKEGQAPVCEVKDPITLKYLLGADMKGLFVPATSGTAKPDSASDEATEATRKVSEELAVKVKDLTKKNKVLQVQNKELAKKVKALEKERKNKE